MKALIYFWLLPLVIPLPVSLGVNLLWKAVSWRLFASWWLIVWATLYLAAILWILFNLYMRLLCFLSSLSLRLVL